ncbi:MAG: type II toxin-antitoxin system RelE/ParE family toxin [Bryobacteraceae bacterium]
MAGYELSPEAENDMFEIWSAIAEDSVTAADRVEEELLRTFASLADFPGQGHWRRDLSGKLRFWAVWDYVIAYRPEPVPILIVSVLHGRRNPDTLARMLTARQKKHSEHS